MMLVVICDVRKPSEVTLQSHHTDPVYSTKSTSFYL